MVKYLWVGCDTFSVLLPGSSIPTGRAVLCWGPGTITASMWVAPTTTTTGTIGLAPSCCPRADKRTFRLWPSCCRNSWRLSIRRSSKERAVALNSWMDPGREGGREGNTSQHNAVWYNTIEYCSFRNKHINTLWQCLNKAEHHEFHRGWICCRAVELEHFRQYKCT